MITPPPTPGTPKKGISGLAIAGIGCGGLFILLAIGGFLLLGKACTKMGEVAGEFQKNPAKAAAMLALKFNPEVEIVSSDDAKSEITIKDKKTGKVVTMSFDEIAQGKFSVKGEDGEVVSIDGSQVSKDGAIKIKNKDGETVIGADGKGGIMVKGTDGETVISGAGSSPPPPAWVPLYPGLKTVGGMRMEKEGQVSGTFQAESTDAAAKIKEYYKAQLVQAGYKIDTADVTANDTETNSISGSKDGDKTTLNVVVSTQNGKTSVMLNYSGAK